jgi:hypothetical protein
MNSDTSCRIYWPEDVLSNLPHQQSALLIGWYQRSDLQYHTRTKPLLSFVVAGLVKIESGACFPLLLTTDPTPLHGTWWCLNHGLLLLWLMSAVTPATSRGGVPAAAGTDADTAAPPRRAPTPPAPRCAALQRSAGPRYSAGRRRSVFIYPSATRRAGLAAARPCVAALLRPPPGAGA